MDSKNIYRFISFHSNLFLVRKNQNRAGRDACHDISPSWSIQTYRQAQQIQKRRGHIDRSVFVAGRELCHDIGIHLFVRMSCRARAMPRYLVNATIYDALPYIIFYECNKTAGRPHVRWTWGHRLSRLRSGPPLDSWDDAVVSSYLDLHTYICI